MLLTRQQILNILILADLDPKLSANLCSGSHISAKPCIGQKAMVIQCKTMLLAARSSLSTWNCHLTGQSGGNSSCALELLVADILAPCTCLGSNDRSPNPRSNQQVDLNEFHLVPFWFLLGVLGLAMLLVEQWPTLML